MIVLKGQVLSNQWIYAQRGKIRFMKKNAHDLKDNYIVQLKEQWERDPIKSEISMEITIYHGDKRRRDIDNYCKLILDSMTGLVYNDDSQIGVLLLTKLYDKSYPRVEIEILEL